MHNFFEIVSAVDVSMIMNVYWSSVVWLNAVFAAKYFVSSLVLLVDMMNELFVV